MNALTPYMDDSDELLPGFDARAYVVPPQGRPVGTKLSPSSRSASDPTLWALEPATAAKHRLYAAYLDAWFPILLQSPWNEKVTYVDAFAGPGEYLDGEDGSPVFAIRNLLNHSARDSMNLTRDRVTLVFLEAREDRYLHLMDRLTSEFGSLDELPINVVVEEGRAERDLMPLLNAHRAWGSPILAVFDSWGNVSVPWTDMRRIALNPSSEIVVTFGPNWFSRFEGPKPDDLDAVFGGREFWSRSDPDATANERWENWLLDYKNAVIRAGFTYPLAFEALAKTGIPLYMVFGTRHPSGVKAFKRAKWVVDGDEGMRFSDPRTTAARKSAETLWQPSLFDAFGDPNKPDDELLGFVMLLLQQKPATVDEIAEFLELDTPQWMASHARLAIRYLMDEGVILRENSGGRLTGSSLLRLAAP